jgi:alkanesulfonate monooxygenase SsuD/methylene tetrahydromethanopterin reductase-like flavin-dependent oxidoreductase (luciferase family)
VAPTEARAEALARPSYAAWYANLTKLWRDFGALPARFARDFDEARQRGITIAGTPAHVQEEIERQVAASGCTYFACRLAFGTMTAPEAAASIDLFTAEVMPGLASPGDTPRTTSPGATGGDAPPLAPPEARA